MPDCLLPCPFCASTDIRITRHPGEGRGEHRGEDVYSMCCYECGATFPNRYRSDLLVSAWNRRARPTGWRDDVDKAPQNTPVLAWGNGFVRVMTRDENGQWRSGFGAPRHPPKRWMEIEDPKAGA